MKRENERHLFFTSVIIVLFLLVSIPVQAVGEPEKVPHQIPKVTSKIRVDGVLDDDAWKNALVLELKYEVNPGENIDPPVKTEVLLAYSNTHFYAAFRAYDANPSAIRARFTDRDKLGGDDYVGVVLDTFSEHRRFYRFHCNPFGVQQDFIETLDGTVDEWDGIWGSSGRINENGYTVEMAIPFATLRFQRKKGDQVWRFDATRVYPRSVVHYIGLFPQDRNNMCYMCQAEQLVGFGGVRPGKSIEIDPTLLTVVTQERENYTEGKFVEKDSKIDPGITFKWGFTPNMTLNATVNPDFSNVEADAAQLDINTQFALYYQEKRPFFLEGANYFYTPIEVVHTRALAEPDWGIKLTGKEGKHAVGFFSVRDSITNLTFPGSRFSRSTSLNLNTTGTALRYRHDLGKSSMLGVVATDREGTDYFNRLLGIDGEIKISRKDRVWFQFLGSHTRYPEEIADSYDQPSDLLTGSALHLFYRHDSRNLDGFISYEQLSPDFRSDIGFVPQVGVRNVRCNVNYNWLRPPGHWFTRINTGSFFHYEMDFDEKLIYRTLNIWVDYNGPLQSHFNLTGGFGKRSYSGINFDYNRVVVSASFRPSKVFELGVGGIYGDQIDYTNVRQGTRFWLSPYIEFNPGKHLSLALDHIYERLKVDVGRLYSANVTNLRLIYQFNRRTFLRTILQYVHYKYNTANYLVSIDPEFKSLFTQILLSYKINPRTVFFLGYSDDYYGDHITPVTQTNRTLFIKIGYALII